MAAFELDDGICMLERCHQRATYGAVGDYPQSITAAAAPRFPKRALGTPRRHVWQDEGFLVGGAAFHRLAPYTLPAFMTGRLRRRAHRTRLAGGLLVLTACVPRPAPGDQAEPSRGSAGSCRYASWSDPHAITPAGPVLRALRGPSLALGHRAFVVGVAGLEAVNPGVSAAGERGVWPPELRVLSLDGTTAPPLRTNRRFWFAVPRAAVSADGTLHVVWGEDERAPTREASESDGRELEVTTLWYARYGLGDWSRPVQIYRAPAIRWETENVSGLVLDDSGTRHLAFTATDSTGAVAVHLRSQRGDSTAWRATTWGVDGDAVLGPPVYADVAVHRRGTVAVAFVAAGRDSVQPQPNAVHVVHSADGGSSWRPSILVTRSGEVPALEPRVGFDSSGLIHVVWRQGRAGEISDGVLWHAQSADDGGTWTNRASVALPLVPTRQQIAVDQCSVVHVVSEAVGARRAHLAYTRFSLGRWTTPELLFPQYMSERPALGIDSTGALNLVWNIAPIGRNPDGNVVSGLLHAVSRPVR